MGNVTLCPLPCCDAIKPVTFETFLGESRGLQWFEIIIFFYYLKMGMNILEHKFAMSMNFIENSAVELGIGQYLAILFALIIMNTSPKRK